MLAKVRLLGWIGALTCAAMVLLRSASWPGAEDPAAATMAVAQVVASVLAAYLALATVLAIRLPRLAPAFVQRLVPAAIGTTIVLAPVAAGAAPQRVPTPSDAPVLHKIADDPSTATSTTTSTTVAPPGSGRESAPGRYAIPPRTEGPAGEVTVAAGDHLWGIAERTLTERLGRAPADREIAPYWSQLIEANRDRLATGDPDLIFAGQVFRLPS
ncbi:MAG: resuscitation-promoting factor RpfA [Actinomycetota bacterium]|jgi:nucleoid-associated protein YgaU